MDVKLKESVRQFRDHQERLDRSRRRTIFLEEAPAVKRMTRSSTKRTQKSTTQEEPVVHLRRAIVTPPRDIENPTAFEEEEEEGCEELILELSSSSSSSSFRPSRNYDDNENQEDIIIIRDEDDELVNYQATTQKEGKNANAEDDSTDADKEERPHRHGIIRCQSKTRETGGRGFRHYEEQVTMSLTVFDPLFQGPSPNTGTHAIAAAPETSQPEEMTELESLSEALPPFEDVVELLEPDEMRQILDLVNRNQPPPTPRRMPEVRNFTGSPLPDEIIAVIREAKKRIQVVRVIGGTKYRIRVNAAGEASITSSPT